MVLAAVLALTLYLPLMAGQLSVASPGFYALGGYIAAIMSTKIFPPGPGLYPVSLVLLEMAVAAAVSGVLGLAVGVPALRLRGIFLALATAAMGINPTYHKVLAFTTSAMLAGAVGAVSAHFINTWNSRQGTFDTSVNLMAFVLVGGSRTFVGPVVGGLVLTALPEALRGVADVGGLPPWFAQFLGDGRLIIFGVLIALGTVFFPHGLITPGLLGRLGLGRRTGKV